MNKNLIDSLQIKIKKNRKTDEEKLTVLLYTFRQEVDIGKMKAKFNNWLVKVEIPLKKSEKWDITIEEN